MSAYEPLPGYYRDVDQPDSASTEAGKHERRVNGAAAASGALSAAGGARYAEVRDAGARCRVDYGRAMIRGTINGFAKGRRRRAAADRDTVCRRGAARHPAGKLSVRRSPDGVVANARLCDRRARRKRPATGGSIARSGPLLQDRPGIRDRQIGPVDRGPLIPGAPQSHAGATVWITSNPSNSGWPR